ncbi:hypothetical protein PIB30_085113 [Stylosanthes scabra]|uniref:Uncharacterized protein n=1 Tax=Stylosanthes scabra TaxID=79078 RepID=A0ABU6US65_9FABA|nr:hypothetical protein [Stylosanthes scabra]
MFTRGSEEEAKKYKTGHHAVARSYCSTSRVPGSVSGCILPTPARPHSPIARPRGCEVNAAFLLYRVTARYRMAESKLMLKMEFQVSGPGPKPLQGPIRPI